MPALTLRRSAPPAAKFTPNPPRVDLLPPHVREAVKARRARRTAIGMVVVAVLGVGAGFAALTLRSATLQHDLTVAQQEQTTLNDQLAVYAPVTDLAVQTKQLTATVQSQTAASVDHAQVLQRFFTAVQDVMTVKQVSVDTSPESVCAQSDPFQATPTAGCVTFTGVVPGTDGASLVLTALGRDEWFTGAFVPTIGSDTSTGTATVTGSVALSLSAQTTPAEGTAAP